MALKMAKERGVQRRSGRAFLLPFVAALACGGCVQHMIGPARSLDDYERKARTTAESALSAVETVILLSDQSARGHLFGSYTNVSVSEQEDALDGVASGFRSIQPPDDRADEVRRELDSVLVSSLDHVAAVRIAARRGQFDDIDDVAAPLEHDADALREFLEGHS